MRRTVKVASTTLVVGAALAFTATPAHAAEYLMFTKDDNPGGYVYFTASGDKVQACDQNGRDGMDVVVRVVNVTKDPNQFEYQIRESREEGKCRTVRAAMGQPYNLAEKHCFRFQVWLTRHGTNDKIEYTENSDKWRNYNNDVGTYCRGVD